MSANTFDIAAAVADPGLLERIPFTRQEVVTKRETQEELNSRLKREERTVWVGLAKEVFLFVIALVSVGLIMFLSLNIILSMTATPDDKKWATSMVTLIMGGVVGYITGKSSKPLA
jgi:hypothetical protein